VRTLIVLAAVALSAVAASSAGAVNAPPVTFTDPAGDSGSAPDITGVSVTNDDRGLFTFTVTFATPYANSDILAIFVDSDKNAATGNPKELGADYLFYDDFSVHQIQLASWQSDTWQTTTGSTTGVVVAPDGKTVTMTINTSDLGSSAGFNFFVLSSDGTFDLGHTDDAPSGEGTFTYDAQTVFTLVPGASHNGAATAGGTWTVSMTAVRSDTKATVGGEGTITCSGSEGSKKLAVVLRTFVSPGGGHGASAVCTFRVPTKPRHALLRATVTVSALGRSASTAFTATAR
jgi:hypothetical protein